MEPSLESSRAALGSADADADLNRSKRFATRAVLPGLQARKQQPTQGMCHEFQLIFVVVDFIICSICSKACLFLLSFASGNALIELGRQAQQLRNSHNEIRMESVESRLMKLHLTIVITSLANLVSVIVEQEMSWRKW
jgi:hypothetical protein